MLRALVIPLVLVRLLAVPVRAEEPGDLHAVYHAYAGDLHVANVEAGFRFHPRSYRVRLAYHTVGVVGFFYDVQQLNIVTGAWTDDRPAPREFFGGGIWRGLHRMTQIDYQQGQPHVVNLVPPSEPDRQAVPSDLQSNTMDTLSALTKLMRRVAASGNCDGTVHIYDGRRAGKAVSHTVGIEDLAPDDRSMFSGKALRCDFDEHMLAGFLAGDEETQRRPLHGSAWLARVVPGQPPLPVRLTLETRWFGDATMYLVEAGPGQLPTPLDN